MSKQTSPSRSQNWLGTVLAAFLKFQSRSRLPQMDGELTMEGLNSPVEIFRDRWGVPHVYAQNLHDLLFAQGFLHAQDRLWQMDFNRRLVSGRLSEVLGSVAIPLDRWMRTLTMRRVAEFEVHLLDTAMKSNLQAYADGVNAWIKQGKLPIEFSLLRYKPELWEIADTLAWIKMMAWSLSVNWEAEILRARLIDKLGPELASELEPPHLSRWGYTLPPDTDFSKIGLEALKRNQAIRPFTGPSPYEGLGSNNWVIAGKYTYTGKPLLANDMHLLLSAPAIWYENHLVGEDLNVTGVTFPGIPGVVSGHNGYVAWGFTNGFPDVQDLYMERIRRTDDGKVQAEYNGQWEDVRILHETIQVKGASPVVEEVLITRHGPIINSLASDLAGEQPLALRWTALETDTMIEGMFHMVRAHNCQEFHQALNHWTTPSQNIVYADTEGNIGFTLAGKIPIRAKGDGRVPVPGWMDEYEWIGYVPFEGLPHTINPAEGFIATANNRTVSEAYPIPLIQEPISGDRRQRIVELIQQAISQGKKINIPYIQNMHFDQLSPSARIVADLMRQIPISDQEPSPMLIKIREILEDWDGTLSANSPAAALYQVFIRKLITLVLSNQLGDFMPRFMGKGPTPVLAETSLFGEWWLPWLLHQLEDSDSRWFNGGNGNNREIILRTALLEAIDKLRDLLGSNPQEWAWGKIHTLTFNHTLGSDPRLSHFFNRGPYPLGGDNTTIWATGSSYHNLETEKVIGPPYRMIVDFGYLDNSVSLLAPGQSGNPASSHYDDQVESWFDKDYHPMYYTRSLIEKEVEHILKLLPE